MPGESGLMRLTRGQRHFRATFKKDIEAGHHQTDKPTAPCLRFPQPGLRMDIPALQSLPQTMHAALGEPSVNRDLSNACLGAGVKKDEASPQQAAGYHKEGH